MMEVFGRHSSDTTPDAQTGHSLVIRICSGNKSGLSDPEKQSVKMLRM
jgi:hypothetical protein